MIQKDLHNNVGVAVALNTGATTDNTALVGNIIDTQGFESVELAILAGSLADAGATFTPSLEQGDDSALSDTSAVAATDLLGTIALATFTQAEDNTVKKLGYRGTKRYIRLTITPAGNAASATFSAVAIKGHPRHAPVS